ncbi:hypothetical protein GCM10007320_38760 [Pseudorhodoferax aquiterrae]|uniref:Uncharacterized protein n=1 Tax=Pseudorhodoferax aquiterrae TaxID=747304 RepID=A0ABQ3G735_9BURK|nr:hypothetical protein [Pseudorhodoferax aquiterrae]GHC90462.1 hypothetical protein GCM10007320_38760 [Pseudorhodoferax aquiterrae]
MKKAMQLLPTMALTVMWPPAQASIVVAIYPVEIEASSSKRNDTIAAIDQAAVMAVTP